MAPTASIEIKKRQLSATDVEGECKKPNIQSEASKPQPKQRKTKVVKRKYKAKDVDATSPLGILQHEIKEFLTEYGLEENQISNDMPSILNDPPIEAKYHRNVSDVEVVKLSSNGGGLAIIPHPTKEDGKQVCLVPFGLPGDKVDIRVFKSHPLYVESDLLKVNEGSQHRDDSLIKCRYFGKCSGCQYQSVDYKQQLVFKKQTIENAYKYMAPILSKADNGLPLVKNTEASPLQYGYRTKLTPHFNLPYTKPKEYPPPSLGFGAKGRPTWRPEAEGGNFSILDIEECTIGTEIINKGMSNERSRYLQDYMKYKKGATILLREDTNKVTEEEPVEQKPASTDPEGSVSSVTLELDNGDKLRKTCVTSSRQIVTEYVNGFQFQFSAGEFFQNNNSILPIVTDYVKSNLQIPNSNADEPNYLVDAYCGSGLFSITCSQGVSRVIGVEVSADSVKFAELNAKNNHIENATFIVGKAEKIFGNIDTPADRTAVILDPPRKGCDDVFLNQLSEYHPARIVYISCNVHSQARDVDWFINKTKHGQDYFVESIKGFDFFPQTHHVESIAVLALKN